MKQKVIFISGGSSGLGEALVRNFILLGYTTLFCARDADKVNATLRKMEKYKTNKNQAVFGFSADVSNSNEISDLFFELQKIGLHPDVLICNAGIIGPISQFHEIDIDTCRSVFDVNFYGTLNLVSAALPHMVKKAWGRVIHISGGGATSPNIGMSIYGASKAAAVRFIETLALEYRDSGITFNSISPGIMKTKMLLQMLEAGAEELGQDHYKKAKLAAESETDSFEKPIDLINFLIENDNKRISGKLISAIWDNWEIWPDHLDELSNSDMYTLRRITGRDRNADWGDR